MIRVFYNKSPKTNTKIPRVRHWLRIIFSE